MKGKLKIFFGYCAGVGKTYAMLQEAQQRFVQGDDIVVGYIEPHDRKDTTDLVYGLEQIPVKEISYHNKTFKEFNLDAALQRNPHTILVDELAHTNVPGSRHKKRYSDIEELLNAGINVYTTVNVQHIESLQDVVENITRVKVNERIPDHVFDEADDVVMVDIEVSELIERLKEGKIYKANRIQQALNNFFLKENLVALRSIALQRCAQRMNHIMSIHKRAFVQEHILVCVSPSPTNDKVIRTAARMAQAFQAELTALFVETEQTQNLSKKAKAQLSSNLELARHLKANIVSTYGNDIAFQISQYAKTSAVSKLVIGRSYQKPSLFQKKTLVDTLTVEAPFLDIYIIPDARSEAQKEPISLKNLGKPTTKDTGVTILILAVATLLTALLKFTFNDITLATLVLVLASCFVGASVLPPLYGLVASIYSVLLLNFFFVKPFYSLHIASSKYLIVFGCLLFVSLFISYLMRRLKQEKLLASMHSHSMDVLLESSQNFQRCNTPIDIMKESSYQLFRVFHRTIIYYPVINNALSGPYIYDENMTDRLKAKFSSSHETAVAKWVYKNNRNAGVSTNTLPNCNGIYLAIRKNDEVFAVVGLAMQPDEKFSQYEISLLKTLLNEIALALDSMKNN